jgi:hypothetical protein
MHGINNIMHGINNIMHGINNIMHGINNIKCNMNIVLAIVLTCGYLQAQSFFKINYVHVITDIDNVKECEVWGDRRFWLENLKEVHH